MAWARPAARRWFLFSQNRFGLALYFHSCKIHLAQEYTSAWSPYSHLAQSTHLETELRQSWQPFLQGCRAEGPLPGRRQRGRSALNVHL